MLLLEKIYNAITKPFRRTPDCIPSSEIKRLNARLDRIDSRLSSLTQILAKIIELQGKEKKTNETKNAGKKKEVYLVKAKLLEKNKCFSQKLNLFGQKKRPIFH